MESHAEEMNPKRVWDKVFPQQWYSKRPKGEERCVYCNDELRTHVSVIWNKGYGIAVCHNCWQEFSRRWLDENLRIKENRLLYVKQGRT